jgi:hypothetical protein
MKKRAVAAFLWFYAGCTAGALLALLIGVSSALGPIIGAVAAALIAGDPRPIIWIRPIPTEGVQDSSRGNLAEAA